MSTVTSASDQRVSIFVSHSHEDARIAEAIVRLIARAFQVPMGSIRCTSVPDYGMGGGEALIPAIRSDLDSANCVLALVTPRSRRAPWPMMEVGASWALNKRPIPVVVGQVGELPAFLSGVVATDAARPDQLCDLLSLIGTRTGWTPTSGDRRELAAQASAECHQLSKGDAAEPTLIHFGEFGSSFMERFAASALTPVIPNLRRCIRVRLSAHSLWGTLQPNGWSEPIGETLSNRLRRLAAREKQLAHLDLQGALFRHLGERQQQGSIGQVDLHVILLHPASPQATVVRSWQRSEEPDRNAVEDVFLSIFVLRRLIVLHPWLSIHVTVLPADEWMHFAFAQVDDVSTVLAIYPSRPLLKKAPALRIEGPLVGYFAGYEDKFRTSFDNGSRLSLPGYQRTGGDGFIRQVSDDLRLPRHS